MRICKSLLRKFYTNSNKNESGKGTGDKDGLLDKRTKAFQQCGAWKGPDDNLKIKSHDDPPKGYEIEDVDDWLVFPEGEYENASKFYGDWDPAKLPFLWEYKIMAVDDYDQVTGDKNWCYSSAVYLANVLPLVLAATALNFLA